MKNTIKRILLLLPVISVLLVALAVPVFADYSPETGWSEPLEVWEPFTITETNFSTGETFNIPIGSPFTFMMDTPIGSVQLDLCFRYCLRVYRDDLVSADLVNFADNYINGPCVVRLSAGPIPGSNYSTDCISCLALIVGAEDDMGLVACQSYGLFTGVNGDVMTPYIYTTEYVDFFVVDYPIPEYFDVGVGDPLAIENQAWSVIPFEVYQIGGDVSPTEPIGDVWTEIMTWITSALNSVMGAFYVDGSLTLLGTLAVIGVSVGIGFLLIGLIQRFLHLRG